MAGLPHPSFSIEHRVQTLLWRVSPPVPAKTKPLCNWVRDKGHSKTSEFHKKQITLKEKEERVLFISVNLSQLFIYVFCETPLTFGDLSQTAAERCQPLILEINALLHNTTKGNGPGPGRWIWTLLRPEVSNPKSMGMQTPCTSKSNLPIGA